ncbi:DUF6443 domain-containing protein [Chryseobacterium sp. S-02]|uniref:DUF6443 domain-containing protein n=1 Tax=Chryseobacterium sp. S-02 TaxID=3404064 RepID=UPI003CECA858
MKKLIIPISALLFSGLAKAQLSTTENYIYTKTYLNHPDPSDPTQLLKTSETVQYFDGLGRPKQIINIKASPANKDLVTTIPYDGFGRQVDSWLPAPMSTLNGGIQSGVDGAAQTYYNDSTPFTHKNFETSPLDRVLSQVQPGLDWQGHPVQFGYDTNVDGEVKKYTTSFNYSTFESSIPVSTTYGTGQLYKNTVTDEDGNKTIEFKNGKGQVVLVRKMLNTTESADTYYVYNDYDQLAFVIPPLASVIASLDQTVLNDLCYQYKYDGRNRLVEKRLPGKGKEVMVYDKADRLVATQDAVMAPANKWLFNKYDKFGRVIYTGIAIDNGSRSAVQDWINNTYGINTEVSGSYTQSGLQIPYGNTAYPQNIESILTVNFYDTYPAGTPIFTPTIPNQSALLTDNMSSELNTKGLTLASYVKNIEDNNWTKNYSYYDTRGRVIATHSINHLGGYTKTESKLDFSGLPQQTYTYHLRKQGEAGITVKERFTYDSQNRLEQHYHQVDDKTEELLAQNTYNDLSQVTNKTVGNGLQSIDYNYNIRGWLTDVNKNQMSVPNLDNKLFSYKIKYTQKEGIDNPDTVQFPGKNVSAKYNGNIAEVDWRAVETLGVNPLSTPKRYGYVYDGLNRLTAGYYQNPLNPTSKENTESLSYDLNGNISSLYRTSVMEYGNTTATLIDNLEYIYETANKSNKLKNINDYAYNYTGYEGGGNLIDYDLNGNMTSMPDKGIGTIQYNYLDLPNHLTIDKGFNENAVIDTKYGADGEKRSKTNTTTIVGIMGYTTTVKITDYLDGFQYLSSPAVTPPGGGGDPEFLMAVNSETARALEMQAFSLDDGSTTKNVLGVKTADLQFFPTAEGFYDYTKDQYIYQYKDHLGNTRVSFGRNSLGNLEIVDNNDYYPFGMNHLKSGTSFFGTSSYKNYKYNGKELQETGMYDYGARFYMPDLGRWGVVDPLAEKNRRFTPYNYAINNPISFIDPDGRSESDWVKRTGQSSWEYNSTITSAQQAKDAGYVAYADGRGDKNSTYTTPMSSNGIDTGIDREVVLGEGGNYTVDGKAFIAEDQAPYVSSKEVDKLGKFLGAQAYIPAFIMSGGSGSVVMDYLTGAATRGLTDLSTQSFFKGSENVDGRQLLINTFVGGGNSFQTMGKVALTNLSLNTANNFGTSYINGTGSQDAAINTVKIFTGGLGNAAGIVGGNTFTNTLLPSIYMNGTDKALNDANEKYNKTHQTSR